MKERVALLADVSVPHIDQRYKMQQEIGAGAQATVYLAIAKVKDKGVKRAVKVFDQSDLEDDDLFDALRMEIMILRQLKHPCAPHTPRPIAPILSSPHPRASPQLPDGRSLPPRRAASRLRPSPVGARAAASST